VYRFKPAMAITGLSWRWLITLFFGLVFASLNIANRFHETPLHVYLEDELSAKGNPDISVLRQKLVGTWQLESYELKIHGPVTITRYPLSSKPTGLLTYSPDGYMSAHLMQPGSENFNKVAYHLGSDKEMAQAAKHNLAYAGTYSVGFTRNFMPYINHTVETSLFPNWLGTNQTRLLEIDRDHLTLLPDEMPTWMVSFAIAFLLLKVAHQKQGMQVEAILKWRKAASMV
jgi:Lipocalin-like domain